MAIPLSIFDLTHVSAGSSAGEAIRNTIDLARRADELGYARYWLAEHHLGSGQVGSSPHTLAALIAASTPRIRIGTAVTAMRFYTPLQIAEAVATVAKAFPGRFDLGLGRSIVSKPGKIGISKPDSAERITEDRVVDGLLIPAPVKLISDTGSFDIASALLDRSPEVGSDFETDVDTVLNLFAGCYVHPQSGRLVESELVTGTDASVWVHGTTAGLSAQVAGERGLPFGSNYHVAPAFTLDAIEAYRVAFRPSARLSAPHVIVSADVVAAPTREEAAHLALGHAQWVLSIRNSGKGSIPYPSPESVAHEVIEAEQAAAIHDRTATRFVGTPADVAERLEVLQRATGADELLLTTITHDHKARVRSFELVAREWGIA